MWELLPDNPITAVYVVIGLGCFCFAIAQWHEDQKDNVLRAIRKELEQGANKETVLYMADLQLRQELNWINTVVLWPVGFAMVVGGWPVMMLLYWAMHRQRSK